MKTSILTHDQLMVGMALADWMKERDFADQERLKWLLKQINRNTYGGKRVYVVYRGDGLVETETTLSTGLKTFWLGDKKERYVFVRLHCGAKLSGMVSVKMYTTVENNLTKIVMDVWPVDETDKPLVGTIWMVEGFGRYGGKGIAPTFAVERLTMEFSHTRFAGTLNGFCFGIVRYDDDFGFDGQVAISNMMHQIAAELGESEPENALPLVITPFGVARGMVKAEYFVDGKLPITKPDTLPTGFFEVLRAIYHDGIKIIESEAVKTILITLGVSEEIQSRFIERMNKMADGGWFQVVTYESKIYYIPTPKLLIVLK